MVSQKKRKRIKRKKSVQRHGPGLIKLAQRKSKRGPMRIKRNPPKKKKK